MLQAFYISSKYFNRPQSTLFEGLLLIVLTLTVIPSIDTVEPVYNGPVHSRHPVYKGH